MNDKPTQARPGLTHRSARTKLTVGAAAGIVVGVSTALAGAGRVAPLLGWCTFAVLYCVWIWASIWPMDAGDTAAHAQVESPGRDVGDALLLGASLASLLAVGFVLFGAASQHGTAKYVQTALAVASVAASWLLVHTVFTLRYARHYYSAPVGGVDFNEPDPPQYSDFAYLAFTIGMTFQVSDTDLKSKALRRAALRHALISFPLGTVIIATTVNLVAGLAK